MRNDLLAISALAVLREEGIQVPEQVSMMGFDNIAASQYTYPPLTTVHVPKSEQGEFMARYLISQIREKHSPVQRRLSAELVVRQSTAVRKA